MAVEVRLLESRDVGAIYSGFAESGWHRPPMLLEGYLAEQAKGERTVIVARCDGRLAPQLGRRRPIGLDGRRPQRGPRAIHQKKEQDGFQHG